MSVFAPGGPAPPPTHTLTHTLISKRQVDYERYMTLEGFKWRLIFVRSARYISRNLKERGGGSPTDYPTDPTENDNASLSYR